MQIRWQEDAINDLAALRQYIAQDNPQAAQRIAGIILERVKTLKAHPFLGKAGRIHTTRELVVVGTPYTIIYFPQPDSVSIMRVLHQAQKW
jgi:toxin ParE1/3/4